MIKFKEGAVCYAGGCQWESTGGRFLIGVNPTIRSNNSLDEVVSFKDFQLNELREGWYIPKSELDTEEKYNKAVEVFGLFGHYFGMRNVDSYDDLLEFGNLFIESNRLGTCGDNELIDKTKCTYAQLMAIGELKRKMVEREKDKPLFNVAGGYAKGGVVNVGPILEVESAEDFRASFSNQSFYGQESGLGKNKRRNKSKQAYDILSDLDYEYDQVKQQWYKKEWV